MAITDNQNLNFAGFGGIIDKDALIASMAATNAEQVRIISSLRDEIAALRNELSNKLKVDTSRPSKEFVAEYMNFKSDLTESVAVRTKSVLNRYVDSLNCSHVLTQKDADIAKYCSILNVAPNSKVLYQGMIIDFYNYLHSAGYISRNPTARIKRMRKIPSSRKALTERQIAALFNVAVEPVDKLFLTVLYGVGLRVGEILRLTPDMFDFGNYMVHIPAEFSKNREPINEVLNVDVAAAIRNYIESNGITGDRPIFPFRTSHAGNVRLKKLMAWANDELPADEQIKNISNHVLRHNFVTDLNVEVGDISIVGKILRHKSLAVTANVYNDTPELVQRRAIAQHPIKKYLKK